MWLSNSIVLSAIIKIYYETNNVKKNKLSTRDSKDYIDL